METRQEYQFSDLTHAIIGAAMAVHRVLGPGFKAVVAGEFRADFIVDDVVVVELKASSALTRADEAQMIHYLKATGKRVGLLINFGRPSLEFRRFVL